MAAAGGRSLAAAHSRATGSACLVPSRASRPRLRALRRSRARSGGEIPVWGPPPAARAGAWGLGAVSVPGTFRRSGAFWLRRWPRVLKAALRGSQVSGAVGVVRGAPVLVPPSAPLPPPPPALFFVSPFHHFCTSRFSFFQPLRSRRAVYTRSWASGRLHRRQASVRLSVLLFSKPVLEGARSAESGEAGPNPGLALSPPCLLAVSLHP